MRLFISYAHVDKPIVKDWIVDNLVAGGHVVWFDDHLIAGKDWKQQLSDEIQRSDALVYAMTPESVASDWCKWELAKAVEFGKSIIPVLLQAKTNPPIKLKQLQYVDFSDGATGDAVARLVGGLIRLSPAQIPPAPSSPRGNPPQAIMEAHPSIFVKFLRDSAVQAVIGILGVVIAIYAIVVTSSDSTNDTPTQVSSNTTVSTPRTPAVEARRDLDIRSGPGANFPRLDILPADSISDIIGISQDRLWYQILLRDGSTGWVLASEQATDLHGDRGVLRVIVPTATVTDIPPTETPTATLTPTTTVTPTNIPSATSTHSPTLTYTSSPATDTLTRPPTNTQITLPSLTITATVYPTNTLIPSPLTPAITASPVVRSYPCEARIIDSNATTLNVVRASASNNGPLVRPVSPNEQVTITAVSTEFVSSWYQITYRSSQSSGWIPTDYVIPSQSCP